MPTDLSVDEGEGSCMKPLPHLRLDGVNDGSAELLKRVSSTDEGLTEQLLVLSSPRGQLGGG